MSLSSDCAPYERFYNEVWRLPTGESYVFVGYIGNHPFTGKPAICYQLRIGEDEWDVDKPHYIFERRDKRFIKSVKTTLISLYLENKKRLVN